MIAVYLCDDEDTVRHQMKTALEWKIFVEDYDMEVVCAAATAQELLDAVEDNRRSVYFLDVDLKDGGWFHPWSGAAAAGSPWHTDLYHQLRRSGVEDLPISSGGI